MLHQRVDARHGGLHARLHHFFGELFFVEDHHFFHVAHAALQVFAQRHNLANHDRRARNRLQHAHLAALNALGDFNFAFAREQRHGAHLAQIHAHRVVGFFQRARRQVELDVFALFELEVLVAAKFGRVEQIDALGADGGDQIVQIVGRANLFRQHVVHVAVGQIALFLAGFDQVREYRLRICRQSPKCFLLSSAIEVFSTVFAHQCGARLARATKISGNVAKSLRMRTTDLRSPAKKSGFK